MQILHVVGDGRLRLQAPAQCQRQAGMLAGGPSATSALSRTDLPKVQQRCRFQHKGACLCVGLSAHPQGSSGLKRAEPGNAANLHRTQQPCGLQANGDRPSACASRTAKGARPWERCVSVCGCRADASTVKRPCVLPSFPPDWTKRRRLSNVSCPSPRSTRDMRSRAAQPAPPSARSHQAEFLVRPG